MRGTLAVLFVLLIGWAVVAVAARPDANEPKRTSFKGWEVYAVKDAGKEAGKEAGPVSFALMIGTNRTKDAVEVQKAVVGNAEELKKQFDQIAAGQWVTFQNRGEVPADVLNDLVVYAKKCGLKVQ